MTTLALMAVLIAASATPGDAASAAASKPAEPPFEMERYSFVILKAGESRSQSAEDAQRIQAEHLAHLDAMAETGKLVLAGPLADQPDKSLRGFCIYRVPLEEARQLAEADPAVKAGRLAVDVMSWWVGKGYVAFPKAPDLPAEPGKAEP